MSVIFKEDTHQYFNTENGHEYCSGTRFLHKFEKPFDEDKFSRLVAKKRGVTQQEILNEWADTRNKACAYGTSIHNMMEDFIKLGTRKEGFESYYKSFEAINKEDFSKAKAVFSELMLWNDEYEIAGTADLIIDHNDKEFSVGDFKTNKEIKYSNEYGERMLDPISHLSACNYTIYSLQLSLYAYFYHLKTGKQCRKVFLMYEQNKEWVYIPANNMQFEVQMMLKYYNQILKNPIK